LLNPTYRGNEKENCHVEKDNQEIEKQVCSTSYSNAVRDFRRDVWKDHKQCSNDELRHEEQSANHISPDDQKHHREREQKKRKYYELDDCHG
jgi:hypothetical protein